ncbi:MAG: hypothetical protein ACJAV7_001571 [Flavobacteriales bacterium]|jgi:hypothetical protein
MSGVSEKRILVVHYSQTGQLSDIARSFAKPFEVAKVQVDWMEIHPKQAFKFPWSAARFFDAFPESVDRIPCEIEPLDLDPDAKYDLIVLAYQVWYMNISIPINSFLKSPGVDQLFKDTPVVTLVGCRNMWVMAQEDIKQRLAGFGSKLVGHVAFIDKTNNLVGLITVLGWMLAGKKKKMFGFLPDSGVSDEDIAGASVFGSQILDYLVRDSWEGSYEELLASGSHFISASLLLLEKRGSKIFKIWSRFIAGGSGQAPGHPARLNRARVLTFVLPLGAFILGPIMAIISKVRILFSKKELDLEIERYLASAPAGES